MRRFLLSAVAALATVSAVPMASAQTLKVVMHSDVKVLDPIWSGAYITRNHGYMLYDVLFAMDEKFQVKPQMVDTWTTSDDGLVWTFKLRDGLEWHDGQPVTAEDCVASLKRWAARDAMGQKLAQSLQEYKVVDPKTFQIVLKEKFGAVIESLGKPSVVVPFMMPKRIAETDPFKQIEEYIGSGPFVFKKDEWKPGEKLVYTKFAKYKPRSEPMSGLSGGKVVSVDRVEWVWIPDAETQVNALLKGELDMLEAVSTDHLPLVEKDKGVRVIKGRVSNQYAFRPNWLLPPFNNEKVRQAAALALNQEDFLQANIGDKRFWQTCKAMFTCGSPLATDAGMAGLVEGNAAKARALLAEAGYDGHAAGADRPRRHQAARSGRKVAAGEGRLQGRDGVDGLAERDRAACQEGAGLGGRLERLLDELVPGRHPRPADDAVPDRELRQGPGRLALRRGTGEAARSVREGGHGSREEGRRHGRSGARHQGGHARAAWRMVRGERRALQYRDAESAPSGHGLLGGNEEVRRPRRAQKESSGASQESLLKRLRRPLANVLNEQCGCGAG